MTVAAGVRCQGGIVFGADTEETFGDVRTRVYKIPCFRDAGDRTVAMITGACDNGHAMDTAVERIFDAIIRQKPEYNQTFGELLRDVMLKLYADDLRVYPSEAVNVHLLVAAKMPSEPDSTAYPISSVWVHFRA